MSSGIVTTATKTCWHVTAIVVIPKARSRLVVGKTLSMRWLAGPAEDQADVLEHEAHADRRDQRGELRRVAQRR